MAQGENQRFSIVPVAGVYPDQKGPVAPGWQISSILLDNFTPHWWTIKETGDSIPPYIQGWSKTIAPYLASLTLVKGLAVDVIPVPNEGLNATLYGVGEGPDDGTGQSYSLDQRITNLEAAIDKLTFALSNPNRSSITKTYTATTTSFTNDDMITAPGVGKRIRVFAISTSQSPSSFLIWQTVFIGNGGGAVADAFWGASLGSLPASLLGDSGYPLTENKPLTLRYRPNSTSAETISVHVIYSIEDI